MRKQFWTAIIFLFFICFTYQVFSQPYYYYHGTGKETSGPVISPEFWRFNFQTNTKELFYSDSVYSGGGIVSWDPTQQWIFLTHDNSHAHMAPNEDYYISTGVVSAESRNLVHVFPDQHPHPSGTLPHSFDDHFEDDKIVYDGIVYNPVKNVFYVTWLLPYADSLDNWTNILAYQRTAIYDATTFTALDTLTVPPEWITAQASVSDDGNYLYLIKYQGRYPVAIGKYSLATKQLTINRNLSDVIIPGIQKSLDDSKKGKYFIGYAYPEPWQSNLKYALYDIDADTSVVIPISTLYSHGSISSDGKYIIIEETPLRPDYQTAPEQFYHPGRISVFNGITGQIIQKLKLPPDGKVLVFDNYPNMLYYYLPKQNRSINIDLSKLGPETFTVKLLSSTGTLLTTGTLQYRDSIWENATNNNDGTFTITTTKKKLSLRMTYENGTQTKSNVTITKDTVIIFQTKNVFVNLKNSTRNPLDTGIVQYNAGGWQDFGTTSNGVATKELFPIKYTFRITYNGTTVSKAQNIDSSAAVVFQTIPTTVQLLTSTGVPLDTGMVQYNAGVWQNYGVTSNGIVTKELLPTKYNFRMTYNGATVTKSQSLDSNAAVVFQTIPANVQLQTSTGALLDTGIVEYNSDGWKSFGTTLNGTTTKELLPTKYKFRVTYDGATISKVQSIDSSATVIFQTVKTLVRFNDSKGNPIDTGIVQFNSGGWRIFGSTTNGAVSKELLPVKYTFRITYNGSSVSTMQNVDSNATVVFSTVLCTVNVTNSSGSPLNNATVSYNAGGWKVIGPTINGIVTIELLPAKIQFRAAYGSKQQSVTQDVSINSIVAITLPVQ